MSGRINHVTMRIPFTLFLVIVAALTVAAAACGGGDDSSPSGGEETTHPVSTLIASDLLPTVISSDLAIGENRFSVGLINQGDNSVVTGANLHLAFYEVDESGDGQLKFEMDADPIVIQRSYTHLHEDGTVHVHEAGETGAYVAYPDFDAAGNWGVEVSGTTADGAQMDAVRLSFNVLEEHYGIAVGDHAPESKQTILSDVDDISEIDTSQIPIPEEHDMTIADAVTSGKPTVIAFATPAFCVSQICGPVKEIFDGLYNTYKDDANFVHVEPYDVACVRNGGELFDCAVPAVNEWGLRSEPWVFIVDADGNISAMFDGIASEEEIQNAIENVIA